MYRIETTDPITGKTVEHLVDMPYVIENDNDDSLVIYFESEINRDLYLQNPAEHRLQHYKKYNGNWASSAWKKPPSRWFFLNLLNS